MRFTMKTGCKQPAKRHTFHYENSLKTAIRFSAPLITESNTDTLYSAKSWAHIHATLARIHAKLAHTHAKSACIHTDLEKEVALCERQGGGRLACQLDAIGSNNIRLWVDLYVCMCVCMCAW
jgi:hypothetical protein